ncbi:MAG: hypothetical protein QXG01_06695, partial [Candidatus Bathyarchaeia archaeon]
MSKEKKLSILTGRKELKNVIKTCEAVMDRKFNPFLLDVGFSLKVLERYFPLWKNWGDYCLDINAINKLSMVTNLQDSQLKLESSSFYIDSEFLHEKFRKSSVKKISEIFLKSWHPTVELEQINPRMLKEAIAYWKDLLPIKERWRIRKPASISKPDYKGIEDLEKIGMIGKDFVKELEALWKEMIDKNKTGKIDYWDFIQCDEYSKTVTRAYLTSFLVTYGYTDLLEKNGKLFLIPKKTQKTRSKKGFFSIP